MWWRVNVDSAPMLMRLRCVMEGDEEGGAGAGMGAVGGGDDEGMCEGGAGVDVGCARGRERHAAIGENM